MTDWEEMVSNIENAIHALEGAHAASQTLKQTANTQAFDSFLRRMTELQDHLSKLKTVLDNEEAYAVDELVEALSRLYGGHTAHYRRTPHLSGTAHQRAK